MVEGDVLVGPVGVVQGRHHRPAGREVDQVVQGHFVVWPDLVIVGLGETKIWKYWYLSENNQTKYGIAVYSMAMMSIDYNHRRLP